MKQSHGNDLIWCREIILFELELCSFCDFKCYLKYCLYVQGRAKWMFSLLLHFWLPGGSIVAMVNLFLAFSTLYLFIYVATFNNKTAMQMKYMITMATLAQNRCVVDCDSSLPVHRNTRQFFRKCVKFHPIFKWNWCTSIVKQHIINISGALLKKLMRGKRVSFLVRGIILQVWKYCSVPQTVAFIM